MIIVVSAGLLEYVIHVNNDLNMVLILVMRFLLKEHEKYVLKQMSFFVSFDCVFTILSAFNVLIPYAFYV